MPYSSGVPPTVAQLVDHPLHAGPLAGASRFGEAVGGERLVVRIGVWIDGAGRVIRARFRATTCASLIAYAEAACTLVERERRATPISPGRLREEVAGVHPLHRDRAELVSRALASALPQCTHPPPGGPR